jgi:hypothetical protein
MSSFSRFPFTPKLDCEIFSQAVDIELVAIFKFQPFMRGSREEEDIDAELIIDRIEPSDSEPCLLTFAVSDYYNAHANWDELRDKIRKDG